MPREKRYADNAARQKAWRVKRNVTNDEGNVTDETKRNAENVTIETKRNDIKEMGRYNTIDKCYVSDRSIVLSDGQVYHPITSDPSLEPSKAYPRQPGRCIRCGGRIPLTDNFCSDSHYKEHLSWSRLNRDSADAELEARQGGQEGASDGVGGVILPLVSGRIKELKAELEDMKTEYALAQRQQDWRACTEINREREPLFQELFKLSGGHPDKSGWFPARFYPHTG